MLQHNPIKSSLALALFILALSLIHGFLAFRYHSVGSDLDQELSSALLLANDLPMYDLNTAPFAERFGRKPLIPGNSNTYHPPAAALLGLPFLVLPLSASYFLFGAFSFAALACMAWRVWRELEMPQRYVPWLLFALSIWPPVAAMTCNVQINIFVVLLVQEALVRSHRQQYLHAAALVGLSVPLKLFTAYLFLFFLFSKQFRALILGITTVVGVTALSLLWIPLRDYVVYVTRVVSENVATYGNFPLNQSLHGLLHPLLTESVVRDSPFLVVPTQWYWVGHGILVLLGVLLYFLRVRHQTPAVALSLAVTLSLLSSPLSWDHTLCLLLFPLVMLSRYRRASAAFLVLLMSVPLSPLAVHMLEGSADGRFSVVQFGILHLPGLALLWLVGELWRMPRPAKIRLSTADT